MFNSMTLFMTEKVQFPLSEIILLVNVDKFTAQVLPLSHLNDDAFFFIKSGFYKTTAAVWTCLGQLHVHTVLMSCFSVTIFDVFNSLREETEKYVRADLLGIRLL